MVFEACSSLLQRNESIRTREKEERDRAFFLIERDSEDDFSCFSDWVLQMKGWMGLVGVKNGKAQVGF